MAFFRSLYLSRLFFTVLISIVFLFLLAFMMPWLFSIIQVALLVFGVLIVMDILLLYLPGQTLMARRDVGERFSNGDANPVSIFLENHYNFSVKLEIIDEIPFQFQKRDVLFRTELATESQQIIRYELRPVERGVYAFGAVNIYVQSPIRLVKRRHRFSQDQQVAVYPSFLQMKQYEFMAISSRLTELGIKKIRRVGMSQEFEQIRPYVPGDEVRTVNWRATARRNELMVNAFQEEKSQAIYCLIDKGRVMQSPFNGLSLLDYAINSTLVMSNIALIKQDKVGVFTFSDKKGQILPAERKPGQLQRIMELLYRQKTRFLETDYELLYVNLKTQIRQRSLLLLFTNFETVNAMRRVLPYLRRLAKDHLVVVIFFENTELSSLLTKPAQTTEEIYLKTIAEKFFYEKQQIMRELQQYGIQSVLTPPEKLTVNTINKYLEVKARGMI
ncbi:DUF58 domain-containing protein [Siphonobacter sp. SORGH_AS_0500]|uniref:DUF58 domain-containing protein n=1 Tax=Siphonobacter sp. SORGH_AS_0500 TaxID=1864824 RepID=UPI002865E7F0|nr:DUF58 domain-containing protein [Siphonobacter sp. SORGH_AS_0500]MDR6193849.1 uncharacterized protein (DUF58 family) [Siphonobacter sp. SORGH_AS_0500]